MRIEHQMCPNCTSRRLARRLEIWNNSRCFNNARAFEYIWILIGNHFNICTAHV